VDAPFFPARIERTEPRPALAYVMVSAAALLWALNGTVSKVILASGVSSLRLAEVRSTGAVVLLGAALAILRPQSLRVRRSELPFLIFFGVCGLALVQWLYFIAIHRIQIGVSLVIQYIAPVLVAAWARFVMHEPVRRRIWVALVLALGGLSLVVDLWHGVSLDSLGAAAAIAAAFAYALYVLLAERAVGTRDPASLLAWGFLFAAIFWAIVQPWWSFPAHVIDNDVSLHGNLASLHLPVWLLMAWMVVFGTVVPFLLLVGALRHVSATRAAIIAMLEPVAGALIAYLWLSESLAPGQLVGGGIVLAAVFLAQTAR
jgi:drug/metabolite transporter (DMT)-like permease